VSARKKRRQQKFHSRQGPASAESKRRHSAGRAKKTTAVKDPSRFHAVDEGLVRRLTAIVCTWRMVGGKAWGDEHLLNSANTETILLDAAQHVGSPDEVARFETILKEASSLDKQHFISKSFLEILRSVPSQPSVYLREFGYDSICLYMTLYVCICLYMVSRTHGHNALNALRMWLYENVTSKRSATVAALLGVPPDGDLAVHAFGSEAEVREVPSSWNAHLPQSYRLPL
jgi:hypothetical protein